MLDYRLDELIFCAALYAFIGWTAEVCLIAVTQRRFSNRGFLNLPFKVSFGVTAVLLIVLLPPLSGNLAAQLLLCVAATEVVRRFSELFTRGVGDALLRRELTGRGHIAVRLALLALSAAIYYLIYLLVHPVIHGLTALLPGMLVRIAASVFAALTTLDFLCVRFALSSASSQLLKKKTDRLAGRMARAVWQRLERAYPGLDAPKDLLDGSYTFAKGLCLSKLAWVFLLSSFLGAMIETVYCYATGGGLMNRSSVLYGQFSFVWGFGAVVLTVTLHRFIGREDRYTFLTGFVVGGAYEYFCSVFTELVFGTVFWDYSHMTLSIAGGRTNAVYCVFWGILAVVWVKILYPTMSRLIERMMPLAGKLLTWAIVIVMGCNGLLTAAAMLRYSERQEENAPTGQIRALLDAHYDDAYMEERWPNMKMKEE